MTKMRLPACLALIMLAGNAIADDDCDDPVSQWQSQEKLRRILESQPWEIRRIKVDDGCYEVYARDRSGTWFEAKYSPATLKLRYLEIEFKEAGGDIADYLNKSPAPEVSREVPPRHQKHGRSGNDSASPQE